jgi:tRNA pseudouridine38-40 synthase
VESLTLPLKLSNLELLKARTLKLTLAYDGSAFHGWQVQPGKPTIQGILAKVIESLTGEKLLPQGSGRTDAGVHALAQIATFETVSPIPIANFRTVLNDRLPSAIRVLAVDEMPEGFHARHSARAKCYHYRIWRGDIVPPFLARYVTHYPYRLNETDMQRAAALVAGQHDFTSFAAVDPDRALRLAEASGDLRHTTNVRTIFESRFERHAEELVYIVRGSGFLHHMVRNLMGTLLLVGKGSIAPSGIPGILEAQDRRAAGPTAPAEGLYLIEVEY